MSTFRKRSDSAPMSSTEHVAHRANHVKSSYFPSNFSSVAPVRDHKFIAMHLPSPYWSPFLAVVLLCFHSFFRIVFYGRGKCLDMCRPTFLFFGYQNVNKSAVRGRKGIRVVNARKGSRHFFLANLFSLQAASTVFAELYTDTASLSTWTFSAIARNTVETGNLKGGEAKVQLDTSKRIEALEFRFWFTVEGIPA